LLVQVSKQVKGFDANINALDTAFQKAPIVFHPIGVNCALRVGDGVVNNLVRVILFQIVVGGSASVKRIEPTPTFFLTS